MIKPMIPKLTDEDNKTIQTFLKSQTLTDDQKHSIMESYLKLSKHVPESDKGSLMEAITNRFIKNQNHRSKKQ